MPTDNHTTTTEEPMKIWKLDVSQTTVSEYMKAACHYKKVREDYDTAVRLFSRWQDSETRATLEKTAKKLEIAYELLRQSAVKLANEGMGIRCMRLPYDNNDACSDEEDA